MEEEKKNDKIFVSGMRFEKPKEGLPDFIRGKISIKVDELIPFLEQNRNEKGWVNIDLKKSKEKGILYLELNTFQAKRIKVEEGEINTDDVPF